MTKQKTKTQATPAVKSFPKTEANRKARLERHLRKHPEDVQAAQAINRPAPIRQKPKGVNTTRQFQKLVIYVFNYGHKNVPVMLEGNGGTELFARQGMSPKDYEKAVNQKRKPMSEIFRETQGKFGSVKPNIMGVEYNRDDVKALCYGLNIKFTGATDRKSAKRKTK